MNRSIQILSVALMLTFASAIRAQTSTCGIVGIDGPSKVDPGTPLVIKAKVKNLPTSTPEFKWWVSAGKIVKGEGTEEITVDTTGLGGFFVTATASLASAPPECIATAAITMGVSPNPPPECPFDTYGDITFEDEKARLDNFAIQIANLYQSRGLILMSAGQITFKGEAAYRLDRIRSYLSEFRSFDLTRIITVDCGFSEDLKATLYVVPFDSANPTCISADQIPLSKVKFTKPRPKTKRN